MKETAAGESPTPRGRVVRTDPRAAAGPRCGHISLPAPPPRRSLQEGDGTLIATSPRGEQPRPRRAHSASLLEPLARSPEPLRIRPQRRADVAQGGRLLETPAATSKGQWALAKLRVAGEHSRRSVLGLGGVWGCPGRAPGVRAPHHLLRAATAATAAILRRVCSLTPALPSPYA